MKSTNFQGLLPITVATAAALHETLINFLQTIGLTADILKGQFVGFCSDGTSCMMGHHRGLATLLKWEFSQWKTFHCMAHRLELAVKHSVDTVNAVSPFRILLDELYKVYSMSPKNQRELEGIASSISVELLKVQKLFSVRWVFLPLFQLKQFSEILQRYICIFVSMHQLTVTDRAKKKK